MKNESARVLTTGDAPGPALQSVKARGRMEGLVLSMTLSQVFRNTTKRNMEVVYTFPLAWGAVLLGMEVTLGGKRRRGQVMPKQEATERYEDAIEKGNAPVMVQKQNGGLYSASVGSLKPGEDLVIDITYAQLMRFEQGRVRLSLPTTVSPRFGDAIEDAGFDPDRAPGTNLLVEYPFTLKLDIAGSMARAEISCPTHPITQQVTDDGVCVSLERKAWLDRDFVLLLDNLQGKSFAITAPDTKSGEGHTATLASFCPSITSPTISPLNIKILVDCSGSMEGDSIELARQALGGLTKLLNGKDTFSLSRFGSHTERVLEAVDASLIGTTRLSFALRKLKADLGGTEMRDAIENTFGIKFPETQAKAEADVLLITDGEVWDAIEIVNSAKASGHRIYALGVGSAPADSLLQELAESTGGACEMVSPNEDMSQAIERMVTRMRQAQAVKAALQVSEEVIWTSPMPKRLANDETVHLFVRTRQPLANAPVLQINDATLQPEVMEQSSDDLIARLMAAQQAGLCRASDEAAAIAQVYQLVTEHTNLLLVFERAEGDKTDGMPDLHQVEHMTAAGWGGTGVAHYSLASQSTTMPTPVLFRSNRTAQRNPVTAVFRMSRSRISESRSFSMNSGMDDIEIPAFLRKQDDSAETQLLESIVPKRKGPKEYAGPEKIMAAFNAAASKGQGFRQTLRGVFDLNILTSIEVAVVKASKHAGNATKAWACYLLWCHQKQDPSTELSQAGIALVMDALKGLDPDKQTLVFEVYEAHAVSQSSETFKF